MTFMIERLATVYSADKGDHSVWRKVRSQPDGKPLSWGTMREAQGFVDVFMPAAGRRSTIRIVEAEDVTA